VSITPLYTRSTHQPIAGQFLDDNDNPVDITGATITVMFRSHTGTPAPFQGAGQVHITNAPQGQFTYAFSAGDIATPGFYDLQAMATWGDGTQMPADIQTIEILATIL
jgi:hypothetical protein